MSIGGSVFNLELERNHDRFLAQAREAWELLTKGTRIDVDENEDETDDDSIGE